MRVHKIDRNRLLPHSMAFNNSICLHNGKILMAYRLEDRNAKSWSQIALCELDEDWQPIKESNQIVKIPEPVEGTNLFEDPRLYSFGDHLVMTFIAARFRNQSHVAAQGIIYSDDINFSNPTITYPEIGNNVNYASRGDSSKIKSEKNWTLLGDGRILYELNPTTVCFSDGKDMVKSKPDVSWRFGKWSGSTPLIPWGDNLLGCFHSFTYGDKSQRCYFVGWYLLNPQTWRIVAYSKEPILWVDKVEDDLRPPGSGWIPKAVFPCGLLDNGDEIVLSYGWLDSTCRISFFSRNEINASLKPVEKWFVEKEVIRNPWGGIPGGFTCTVEDKFLRAKSWPALLREAKHHGVIESDLHAVLCARISDSYKTKAWGEE